MKTALYSTFYPAMLPYLKTFWESVSTQSDTEFDMCFALDGLSQADIESYIGKTKAHFFESQNDTVASLRERVLVELCEEYDTIILVDSDDILLAERVSSAKKALETHDAYGCALELIDTSGKNLDLTFTSAKKDWSSLLSKLNIFGFSNTAYRSETLKACFPIPKDTVMVDWLVISKALAQGSSLVFDESPQMLYRQYETNTARVISPYSPAQIKKAASLVEKHYDYVLSSFDTMQSSLVNSSEFKENILEHQQNLLAFQTAIKDDELLEGYTKSLNGLKSVFLWWECVAHSKLKDIWLP